MDGIDLYHGDCLDIMPQLPAQSIDAIITDLPYGTTACAWDSVIPFAPMWEQVRRILKPRGAFITTASQPFTSALIMSNIEWFKYCWVWEKQKATGHLDARRKPLKAHEDIVVFGGAVYNPQMGKGSRYKNHHKPGDTGQVYGEVNKYSFDNHGERFPRSVIQFTHELQPEHPTQKPVSLYSYLVRTYTNHGDTVLDIAMGSGTTGVACAQSGRKFIGIERATEYFTIAQRRIAYAAAQLVLFQTDAVYNQVLQPTADHAEIENHSHQPGLL